MCLLVILLEIAYLRKCEYEGDGKFCKGDVSGKEGRGWADGTERKKFILCGITWCKYNNSPSN